MGKCHQSFSNIRKIPPCSEDPWPLTQKWSQDTKVVPRDHDPCDKWDSRSPINRRLWHCSSGLSDTSKWQIFTNLIKTVCFQMLQSVIYRGIRLQKHYLKDLHFLSRTFADLPNIRGDGQKSKTPAKPPDFSPAQQKGKSLLSELPNLVNSEPLRRPLFSGTTKWWSFITCS